MATQRNSLVKTCLLVDDDEDDKEIFCLALQDVDPSINCVMASDGREALAMLNSKTLLPDYIFLDLNMPLMDGKECLKKIREQNHLKNIPVIIFSTSSSKKDKEETEKLGANAFITKPPLVSALAEKLSDVFSGDQ